MNEELKQRYAAALHRAIDNTLCTEPSSDEPVAWMMKAREPSLHCPDYVTFEKPTRDMKISHHPYPLYTHPAKTLTDEEINQVAIDMGMFGDLSHDEIELCRNVLRKASEK